MWKWHSVRRKRTHKNLQTHINTHTDKHACTQTHTHINLRTTKPPVLSSPAVSGVVSKAACGAELWCCREDQVQMGFSLSDRPARRCSVLSCFVTLCIALASTLIFPPLLSPFVLFQGFPVLVKSNRDNWGDMQQRRWAGCKPTMCVCVYLGSKPPGRPSVFLITKTTSRNRTRYCQERIKD